MSLFGEDDTFTPSRNRQSGGLFDGNPAPASTKPNSSSLFADDSAAAWSMPTPKKAARTNVVKNLLQPSEIPEAYVGVYDALLASDGAPGGNVGVPGVRRVIEGSGLDREVRERIMGIVNAEGRPEMGRGEVWVLLALVGLAQEGEEIGLDAVDERRKNLPTPNLGSLNAAKSPATQQLPASQQPPVPATATVTTITATPTKQKTDATTNTLTSSKPRNMGQESFGTLDSDPWGSPELHKGHNHAPQVNGTSSHPTTHRTTSAFTTTGSERQNSASNDQSKITGSYGGGGTSAGGWGSSNDSFRDSGLGGDSLSGGGGFGHPSSGSGAGGDRNDPTGLGHSIGIHRGILSTTAPDEVITVTSIPEKEGMMFFQHRNYEVASARRSSKVVRRYSDFVWLLDCLHKRYPYRQLPLLPPKRVAINGNHIAAESNFIEKRRRGLARFANALVRHHVLAQEQLVIMFLTVPTELAVWRKQATITVQDEFLGKSLPPHLEDSLPQDLEEMFTRVRSGVRRSAEVYINLCVFVERLGKRSEGVAAEYMRIGNALAGLTEASADTFAVDTNDVPLLNAGLNGTSKHMGNAKALLVDEARAIDEGVLEDMKTVRDRLVSVRDVFDRRDRLERDEIPRLERRIKINEEKLKALRARPEGSLKPGEAEKVEDAILRDKEAIVQAHNRTVFIKECIRDELLFFHETQYAVSRLYQDWASERVKYAELLAENWRAASEEVEGMPVPE